MLHWNFSEILLKIFFSIINRLIKIKAKIKFFYNCIFDMRKVKSLHLINILALFNTFIWKKLPKSFFYFCWLKYPKNNLTGVIRRFLNLKFKVQWSSEYPLNDRYNFNFKLTFLLFTSDSLRANRAGPWGLSPPRIGLLTMSPPGRKTKFWN